MPPKEYFVHAGTGALNGVFLYVRWSLVRPSPVYLVQAVVDASVALGRRFFNAPHACL